jgi:tetratricopeptide (TPR) repeat protein
VVKDEGGSVDKESDLDALRKAALRIIDLVADGEEDEAVERLLTYRSRGEATRDLLVRTVISSGQHNQDAPLTRAALRAFEQIKQGAKPDAGYYYDVASGYQVLYEKGAGLSGDKAFEMGSEVNSAIKYFARADAPEAKTNLGNLLDTVGRPIEALNAYQEALFVDPEFGMAWGNWGLTLERLAMSGQYSGGLLLNAYHLLQEALDRPTSVIDIGGHSALGSFFDAHERIEAHFVEHAQGHLLDADHHHEPRDDSAKSDFVQFYTTLCIERDLYINLHLMDRQAEASVGDTYLPTFISSVTSGDDEFRDLAFRLNEIHETYASSRYFFVRAQYSDPDTREISEQTTLINTLDYAASNLYVGLLKSSYKEAFSTLDKLAVLLNHYLEIGHDENHVYYGSVWFAPDQQEGERRIAEPVRAAGYRLFGAYLLCLELRGSRFSNLRNAMTHRYARVFKGGPVPKGGYDFEKLIDSTAEVLFKVKCAVIYVSQYIHAAETNKFSGELIGELPAWTNQNLDLW